MCDCTSCRNLGNSVDVCCQCCSCSGGEYQKPNPTSSYHVSSVTLTGDADDTLEVVFDSESGGGGGGGCSHHHQEDELAMAHAMAESGGGGGACECQGLVSKPCSDCYGGGGSGTKRPHFNGWSSRNSHHHGHSRHTSKHSKSKYYSTKGSTRGRLPLRHPPFSFCFIPFIRSPFHINLMTMHTI